MSRKPVHAKAGFAAEFSCMTITFDEMTAASEAHVSKTSTYWLRKQSCLAKSELKIKMTLKAMPKSVLVKGIY